MKMTCCKELVMEHKNFLHIPEKVVELFPGDPYLAEFAAVSYMGFPLLDPDDHFSRLFETIDRSDLSDDSS